MVLIGLVVVVAPMLVAMPTHTSAAAPDFGRTLDHWYYTGQYDWDATYMFSPSPDIPYPGFMPDPYDPVLNAMDAASFIEAIRVRLFSPTDHNRARASIIVNMMLGIDGTDTIYDSPSANRWENGVTIAQSRFWSDWVPLINDYATTPGRANFNATFFEVWPEDWSGAAASHVSDPMVLTPPANDSIHHILQETIDGPTVEFYDASGNRLMAFLKNCANLVGGVTPLPPIDPPPPPPPVTTNPYTTFYNGDAEAGASFDCTVSSIANGDISAFGNAATGTGSGSQIGAFAPGSVEGFNTAQRTGSVGSLTLDSLGSGFCMPDYASLFELPATQPEIITGPYTMAATNWGIGARKDILVRGDVYISGNITYDPTAPWNAATIPAFRIISLGGNIYIDPSVTALDGLYVAVPSSAGVGGYIFTCASSSGPLTSAQVAAQCGNQLVVTGAMAAKQVKLLRTYGDVGASTNAGDQDPYSAGNRASERFIFTPELWLPRQASTPPAGYQFDAIANLPPVVL